MDVRNRSNVNFGYNYETHRFITKKAMKYVPELDEAIREFAANPELKSNFMVNTTVGQYLEIVQEIPAMAKDVLNKFAINKKGLSSILDKPERNIKKRFKQEIADGTMLPDLLKSETGFVTSRHFFFRSEHNKVNSSFGPNSYKNNAKIAFYEHLVRAFDNYSPENMPKEIGMALHFLQDMTVPMHTRRQTFFGKGVDFFMHRNFEKQMLINHEQLAENYTPGFKEIEEHVNAGLSRKPHLRVFSYAHDFSSQPERQITRRNKKDWAEIQQEIFNRAVDSTIVELKTIAKEIKEICASGIEWNYPG